MALTDEDNAAELQDASTKSFWAHLNDLRAALVKSAMAVGVGLVLCLFLGDRLVALLEYPLHRMGMFEKPRPSVSFQLGDTTFGPYTISSSDAFAALPGVNANATSANPTATGGGGKNAAPQTSPSAPAQVSAQAPLQLLYHVGTAQVDGKQVVTLTPDPAPLSPTDDLRVKLHNFSPTEAFFVAFHVAIYGGLVVSSPFWVFFMGQFILPALNIREKRALGLWLGWGTFLFLLGVALTYFLLLPVALRASIEYSQLMGFEAYDWRADDYIGFVTKFIFGMGLGFQFPVVVLLLVKMGILTHRQLASYRRYVIVICLILGAVLTTPEVITQVCMAVPLYILYEASIWIAWYWDWKRRRAARQAGEVEED